MKRRIWTIAVGLAAIAALIAVPAAMAAYTSREARGDTDRNGCRRQGVTRSERRPDSSRGDLRAQRNAADDEPGSGDGARTGSRDREGARSRRRRPAARGPARRRRSRPGVGCESGGVHRGRAAARHVGDGAQRRRGRRCPCPTYLVSTTGTNLASLGPAFIGICLPPPDVPVGTPGRATFGAKVYSAELAVNGVFSKVATGAWISLVGAVHPGSRQAEPGGCRRLAGRDRPGRGEHHGEELREGSGRRAERVTQAGQPRGGATVTIFGGSAKSTG